MALKALWKRGSGEKQKGVAPSQGSELVSPGTPEHSQGWDSVHARLGSNGPKTKGRKSEK